MELGLAIGLALFLGVTLAAGLGLSWLRARESLAARRQAELLPRVRRLIQEFSQQIRRQPLDPGPPYTAPLAEAGKIVRRGWARIKQVEARVKKAPPAIAVRPLSRLFFVFPIYQEWTERLKVEYRLFEDGGGIAPGRKRAARARARLEVASQLGKREQAALDRLRAETTS